MPFSIFPDNTSAATWGQTTVLSTHFFWASDFVKIRLSIYAHNVGNRLLLCSFAFCILPNALSVKKNGELRFHREKN
jgi:hypothetical protein